MCASREIFQSEVSRIFILGGASMVKVNGTELDIAGKTVSEYLAETDYDPKRIAVERNGDIVFKSQYDVTVLEDGDSLEIVSFVGGG
jgi:sulfur carrier protein